MGLFQDVTAEYAKHVNASQRMTPEKLRQLHDSGLAIADTETTGLKAGENGLLELAVIRAMTIGEMKNYNREAKARGLPDDQRIAIPRGYADSEIRLIALQHFVLPHRPMIHDRDVGLKIPSGSYTSDLQRAYEYETSAYALGVTGTELDREKGYGPIKAMKVGGEKVDTLPSFVPLMDSFLLFTGTSTVGPKNGVAYFNAPFDMPFLRELFVDAMAYNAAKNNEHRDHHKAVHRGIDALDVDYNAETTTPEQRAKIVAHIKKRLMDSGVAHDKLTEYFAPARWHCVLQAFRAAHPELGGHTLDTLMKIAGLGERGEHSAIEDVTLTALGMLHLFDEGKLGQSALPNVAELPGVILHRSHGDGATSYATENGRDVVIELPKGESAHAKAVEYWIRSFNRAKPADPRQPESNPSGKRWFSEFHEDDAGFRIVASGAEKRPLFLSFIKHLGVASQMLDGRYPWLTVLEANDKPGTFVDVTIDGEILHDVPWNILRRNMEYISAQPAAERADLFRFLRDIEKGSDALGGVLLREENERRYLRLYGHVRQHGTVDIPWPKDVPLAEARERLFKQLEEAIRLGLVPHASRAQLHDRGEDDSNNLAEEDAKHAVEEKFFSATTYDFLTTPGQTSHIHREITPAMFQLFKAAMPPSERIGNFSRYIDTVKFGKHYRITVGKVTHGDKSYITLDGPPEAFDAYVARPKEDGVYEAMAEKPTNILTDAGWLLDRLQKIPGVPKDGVEVTARNRIIVHQPLGVGTDALALMHAAQIPYRAEEKELRFSAGALMQDAFTYSLSISRSLKNNAHEKLMGPESIIPSIVKGLKDTSEKDENHKKLGHVKWDPLLGLQLHYKPHARRAAEIIRIPPDKMLARSLPIGRRRMQRVFARLGNLPQKIESLDRQVRWEVTLTPLEQALFNHALNETGAQMEWRRNSKGEPCFVISERELSARGNVTYLAMQTMSDQLAELAESTSVPEWNFSAQPQLDGDTITLTLPEDRRALFQASAKPIYEGVQKFLAQVQKDASGVSLDKNLRRIMGDREGNGGSPIRQWNADARRDNESMLSNMLTLVEHEAPALLALHQHTRSLASAITPSTVPPEDTQSRRTLALNQELLIDRRNIAQMIAACDAMADQEPQNAGEWMALRNKATDTADRMARAIHEADRLKEALNTGASKIANDGAQWRSSLIGASIHARLDTLDEVYRAEAREHASGYVENTVQHASVMLKQFGMRQGDGKWVELLQRYRVHAAQRLAVMYAVEHNPERKPELAAAAKSALSDAYGFVPAISEDLLKLYETMANPATSQTECKLAGEAFIAGIPNFSARDYWLPMVLFGKATKEDVVATQRAEFADTVDGAIKKAYHETGVAHLYLAAEMQAELIKLQAQPSKGKKQAGKLRQRMLTLEIGVQYQKTEMLRCYRLGGYPEETAVTQFRTQTRAALREDRNFQRIFEEKKAFLSLHNKRADILEYSPDQQERILQAGIAYEGGREKLEAFLYNKHLEEVSFDAELQSINSNAPTFEVDRAQRHKAAILNAKQRLVEELDDLGKIESHARRDIEALGMFFQHEAVKLDPSLEATPINPRQMDLPEFQGLKRNHILDLRAGAETLDRQALRQAKEAALPDAEVTKQEYATHTIKRSLSTFLGISPEEAKRLVVTPPVVAPKTHASESDYFLLDTSAVIGYFDTLRQHVPRPYDLDAQDFVRYHSQLLHRLERLAQPENHGHMPLRIPDYVFYELSGLMPPMLHQATKKFAAIEAAYAPKLERAESTRRTRLLEDKAKDYQREIDNLVDWSIRLDRRRPLDEKSTIGDRVEELNQLFTLFAYHPEIQLPTRAGQEYFRSARIESAVVAGIGALNQPATPAHYRAEMAALSQAVSAENLSLAIAPDLGHYALSFNDVLDVPELNFKTDKLRIHWGQMYFMGLIDEHQYRDFMRNMSGAKEANAQGHDNNSRFVTYGSLINRTKETGLTGSGLVRAVKNAKAAMEYKYKSDDIHRHNLTFGELQNFVPELEVQHAIGPAKLTMDQAVFGGLLPGAAIKRHRVGGAHEVRENDAEVETLRLMARTLGYAPHEINPEAKDRYEHLRNSLKHQGFFERSVTLGDCVRIQYALVQAGVGCEKLDRLLAHIPEQLSAKLNDIIRQKNSDGSVELSAPIERIFTQALVHGVLNSAQFAALLVKLDPSSFDLTQAPRCNIKVSTFTLQFELKSSARNIRTLSADKLAAAIKPKSCWLHIRDQSAPHLDRLQNFDELVAMGRSARRSGTNFSEGQTVLDRLLASQFRANEAALQRKLSIAHAVFAELFGATEGDAIFFQLMKDFESRQERQFQAGDYIASTKKPAECAIAANHRNRLIARRNLGEVSVVEAAHTLQADKPGAQLWVMGNDHDVISREQYRVLDPEIETSRGRHKKSPDALAFGKQCETPGVRLRPPVAAQHSRYVTARGEALEGDERTHNVPTRDGLEYVGRLSGVSPLAKQDAHAFTHKYAKASTPFRERFGG